LRSTTYTPADVTINARNKKKRRMLQ
jgi:hypothetical protein